LTKQIKIYTIPWV